MADTPLTSQSETRIVPTAINLLQRCQQLLDQLETFKDYLKARRQDHQIEIAHFRNTVKSEHRTLQRLVDQNDPHATQHVVNSSNLPFLEAVWNTLKANRGLQAMQKRFYWQDKSEKRPNKKKNSALVDIVAEDGLHWLKVSLLTNNRLLFDKAKQGWEDASSSDDSHDDQDNENNNDVPLVKMTRDLVRAAQQVKIRTKHPRITLVLPKIRSGQVAQIDAIISQLRHLGADVLTSESPLPALDFATVMPHLLTDPFATMTSTLNIDCTILLALVSDFSHSSVEAEPWFHRALKRQVEIEDAENLLPNLLYPALANRKLICTDAAAKRMREIVSTIGTPSEKERTALFMGDTTLDINQVRQNLAAHSRFDIPDTLRLPITVEIPEEEPSTLPPSAARVKESLTAINQSVFLHGWAKAYTTITSNRTVVKQVESVLSKQASDETEWPMIWLCPTARSLVGKEKGRRD
jgi:hypothetical protein